MYVCMHKHVRLGGSGGMLPQETFFLKLDALRLLLRPFWDRSRIVVATWLTDNCILAVHVHLLSLREKVLRLAEQQAGNITYW